MFDVRPHENVNIYSQGRVNLVAALPAVFFFLFPKLEECMHQYRFAPRVLSREEGALGNKASAGSTSHTHTHTLAREGTSLRHTAVPLEAGKVS